MEENPVKAKLNRPQDAIIAEILYHKLAINSARKWAELPDYAREHWFNQACKFTEELKLHGLTITRK